MLDSGLENNISNCSRYLLTSLESPVELAIANNLSSFIGSHNDDNDSISSFERFELPDFVSPIELGRPR